MAQHCGLCPLYPQKRTLPSVTGMSALCQKRTLPTISALRETVDCPRNGFGISSRFEPPEWQDVSRRTYPASR
jgi:hypothetical protein